MSVLVYPHAVSIGGSQLNSIELAAAVDDLGYEVKVFGVPGPLGGPARDEVFRRTDDVNLRRGSGCVTLIGSLPDPRPTYAAADVVLWMGSSILRAMAFGKPVVVEGESGFWKPLKSGTIGHFLWAGWYGVGPANAAGHRKLRHALTQLTDNYKLHAYRGGYALEVVEHSSLELAAHTQVLEFEAALGCKHTVQLWLRNIVRTFLGYGWYAVRERWRRVLGTNVVDDCNSKPVAAIGVRQCEVR